MAWVLVVEDNSDIGELLKLLLGSDGHQVVVKTDGAQALEFCSKLLPDVVLLDVALPGEMDGLTVARTLREDESYAGVRLLMLTARSGQDDVAAGYEAGADGYLVKPFRAEVLLEAVRTVLGDEEPVSA